MSANRITLGSPAYRVFRHIGQCKQPSRYLATRVLPERYDLTRPSSYARVIGKQNSDAASTSQVKQDDFVLYPDLFSREEQAVLIRLGLWKLDRVDTKKKRRRRRKDTDDGQGKPNDGDLQTLFEDKSMYGFEEVR
jgi:alkylated DNA repair protein alkB family protein 7